MTFLSCLTSLWYIHWLNTLKKRIINFLYIRCRICLASIIYVILFQFIVIDIFNQIHYNMTCMVDMMLVVRMLSCSLICWNIISSNSWAKSHPWYHTTDSYSSFLTLLVFFLHLLISKLPLRIRMCKETTMVFWL